MLLELIQTLAPAIIVGAVSFYAFRTFVTSETRRERFLLKKNAMKDVLPIRLQAYERMTLFLERIKPENVSARIVPKKGQEALAYKILLMQIVKQEYNHNISQQIYMSLDAWRMIDASRVYSVSRIQQCYKDLPEKSSAQNLYESIIKMAITNKNTTIIQQALHYLKRDVQNIFR